METIVTRQLWMEGGREQPVLACRDDASIIQSCECLDVLSYGVDARRANKDRRKRRQSQCRDIERGFEAIELAAKRVAPGGDIHQLKRRLPFRTPFGDPIREQDHTGAGTPDRHLAPGTLLDWLDQTICNEQL